MSAHRTVTVLALLLLAGLVLAVLARAPADSDAARADRLAAELRCPVCQGLSVKDSPSDTARAIREVVSERVAQGRSDDEIRNEFRRAYGDWILLSPPMFGLTGIVWLAPLAAVLAGLLLATRAWRSSHGGSETSGVPTPEQISVLRRRILAAARREKA